MRAAPVAKASKALELSLERFVWSFRLRFMIFVLNAFRHHPKSSRGAYTSGRSLLLLALLQSALHLSGQITERFRRISGEVGQHLAIQLDPGDLQAMHELRIVEPVQARGGSDA